MDPQIVTIICYVIICKLKYRTGNIIVFVTLKEEVESADYTDTAKRLWIIAQGFSQALALGWPAGADALKVAAEVVALEDYLVMRRVARTIELTR